MSRPVTLFTGQWADLSLAELAPQVKAMGYDGVELACWGDHFEVDRALAESDYVKQKWALLQKHGLTCHAISDHRVRQRAAEKVKATARAARKFFSAKPGRKGGDNLPAVVNGFTGSSIWHAFY